MPIKIVDWGKHYENYRTRELRIMTWVPIPNKQDGEGYTTLLDHPNGAAHLGAWCALVQVASRCTTAETPVLGEGKNTDAAPTRYRDSGKYDKSEHPFGRGILSRNGKSLDETSLARMTRIPLQIWHEVLPRLASIGWISGCEYRDTTDVVPSKHRMNGMEWNGMELNTTAPTRSTESAPKPVTYDFTTGLFGGVTDEMVTTWQVACPAVSVDREIVKAAQWLLANPAKRKKNYRRFLLNWIMRAQERGKG